MTSLSRNRWFWFEAIKSTLLLSAFMRTALKITYYLKRSVFFIFVFFHNFAYSIFLYILLWIENTMHSSLSFVWSQNIWFTHRHSQSLLRLYDINQSKSSHNTVRVSTETENVEKNKQQNVKPTHIQLYWTNFWITFVCITLECVLLWKVAMNLLIDLAAKAYYRINYLFLVSIKDQFWWNYELNAISKSLKHEHSKIMYFIDPTRNGPNFFWAFPFEIELLKFSIRFSKENFLFLHSNFSSDTMHWLNVQIILN